jgi:hypothetical protein
MYVYEQRHRECVCMRVLERERARRMRKNDG